VPNYKESFRIGGSFLLCCDHCGKHRWLVTAEPIFCGWILSYGIFRILFG